MAKFKGGSKPANQGSAGTPHVQAPKTSGTPSKTAAPRQDQTARRGVHSAGTKGSRKS